VTVREITCEEATWLVSESRERDLTPEEIEAFENHIAGCAYCHGASSQFVVMFQMLKTYFKTDDDEGTSK
jgi:hypothetical protein